MARPELGEKRDCPDCGARFYDLGKDPAFCPKCGYKTSYASIVKKPEVTETIIAHPNDINLSSENKYRSKNFIGDSGTAFVTILIVFTGFASLVAEISPSLDHEFVSLLIAFLAPLISASVVFYIDREHFDRSKSEDRDQL